MGPVSQKGSVRPLPFVVKLDWLQHSTFVTAKVPYLLSSFFPIFHPRSGLCISGRCLQVDFGHIKIFCTQFFIIYILGKKSGSDLSLVFYRKAMKAVGVLFGFLGFSNFIFFYNHQDQGFWEAAYLITNSISQSSQVIIKKKTRRLEM